MSKIQEDRERIERIRVEVNQNCYAWVEDSNWLLSRLSKALDVVESAKPFSRKWEKMLPSITYQDSEHLQWRLSRYEEDSK